MHGFNYAEYLLPLALISLIMSMSLWFRDIVSEGKRFLLNNTNIWRKIDDEYIKTTLSDNMETFNISNKQLGYYLAGLLEGEGHIYLPFLIEYLILG